MKVVIRRSAVMTAENKAATLAESIAIDDIHTLLYQRGEIDLADALTASLEPDEARAVAVRLRHMVRHATRRRFFRDYRRALHADEAARLGLVALWYERAGQTGCHVWAELPGDPTAEPVSSRPHLALVTTPLAEGDDVAQASADALAAGASPRLMPDWLAAPESSVWSA